MAYECWMWLVEEEDGREGVIAALIPEAGMIQPLLLQNSKRELAEALEPIARQHGASSGRPVRLAHLVEMHW